ncbi:MAG: hypothetical protein O2931_07040 [Planctomycetota bacterium]|nr:hypothetical protein [Planctomycetota bacterium]MDA1178535.1 hypothetical protein [Planctomycetota bacterium]
MNRHTLQGESVLSVTDRDQPVTQIGFTSLLATALVWMGVCTLNAAPSFFIAFTSVASRHPGVMLVGVAIFIGIFSGCDLLTKNLSFRQHKETRMILRTTFVIRSLMVVVYPLAFSLDFMLGAVSTSLAQSITTPLAPGGIRDNWGGGFVLLVTLIQGTLISCFLILLGMALFMAISIYIWIRMAISSHHTNRIANETRGTVDRSDEV